MANNTSDRELLIERTLNAPCELVWNVFTDPDHIKNWWGPDGFTNTIETMDVRPGGIWEFIMHGPDGTHYRNKSIFREIVKPERIVFDHITSPKFTTTITFKAIEKKTALTWHMLFESKEQVEQVVKTFKADEGLKQNIEKLKSYLRQYPENMETPFTIERFFKAPVSKVWKAITDKNEMKKWYFDLAEFKAEQGFEFQFSGGPSEERQYLHLCKVTEVIPNKKLTYSWRYEGYAGISFVTFDLFEEGDGTRLKLTHSGLETFPAEKDFAKENFVAGWTDIIGRSLKEYLEI